MKNIAIILARSGSKGLPHKNIKELKGKPLMAYSIEAAIKSRLFDVVHVSTDSSQYADIAKEYGADEPFLRSEYTSSDSASSWDAIREVLMQYEEVGEKFDNFMLLQPTSPLRTAEDIQAAFKLLDEKNALAVVSVCPVDHSPLQCNTLPKDLSLVNFRQNESRGLRRQMLEQYYRFNGSIYLSRVSSFLETGDIYQKDCYAYVMDRLNSIDIDDEVDFKIARALLD